jgi:biopolymer transport protein ExbD
MKIRKGSGGSGTDKVEINMTPMIDVVFQLLSFFVMSFKIVSQEGDFNVKMPIAAPREGLPDENLVPPLKVRITAGPGGQLGNISLNDNQFGTSFQSLHEYVAKKVGEESGPSREAFEVELDCDYDLKYTYIIEAITAVSGRREGDQIIKLVEKIKFSPPRKPVSG